MKRVLHIVVLLISCCAAGQNVNLLRDINQGTNLSGSSPTNFTKVGSLIFFTATDQERGTELWKTDGTTNGTVVVKDINQGNGSSSPSYLTVIGSLIYFAANDGINGSELWRSDGTAEGTTMVQDINPGSASSVPAYIIAVGTTLYFSADKSGFGRELWKSDGTSPNTVQLAEINVGSSGSNPAYLTNANGTVYFQAFNPSVGTELYKTTGGAPSLVEDMRPGPDGSNPFNLVALNSASSNIIFFSAYDPANGQEPWRSDGTLAGTSVIQVHSVLVSIFPSVVFDNTGSSFPDYFVTTGSMMYFAATSSGAGREMYRHDGTTLALVQDFVAAGDLNPINLVNVNGTIYFSGIVAGDRELYKATSSAVTLVANINAASDSNPSDFEVATSNVFYFSATHATLGTEFYSYTVNTATLSPVVDINPGTPSSSPLSKAYLNGALYMSAHHDTFGRELWLYNGSTATQLKDINGGTEDGSPVSIFNTGSTLYFNATTSTTGAELWKSDGTFAGTVPVADINAGTVNSSPFPFGFTNSLIHFSSFTAAKGTEFYVSSGATNNFTLREINTVNESGSYPASYDYVTMGTTVFFSAFHPDTGYELWRSVNGGTALLVTDLNFGTTSSYPQYLTVFGGLVYFSATDDVQGTELYRTNGSGATLVGDLNGAGSSSPYNLTLVGGSTLYFVANNGSDGTELYKTTGGAPSMVKSLGINPAGDANPQFLTDMNGVLFFRATDGTNGNELWKSDGTDVGTTMVKNIHPSLGSDPGDLTVAGNTLYFTATEPTNGRELHKSDGTTVGTVLVKDIFSGTANSTPSRLTNVNGTLYFRASNGAGLNLMKTNGTSAGTIVATSAGVTYQGVDEINYLNGNVYWVGTTNLYGRELLAIKAEPLNQPASVSVTAPTATTLNVSWPAAAGSAGYIVIRNEGSAPTGLPVDGLAPAINSTLLSGTGSVAYVNTGTGFTDTGLLPNTTYHYKVFSYADGGVSTKIYKPHSPPANIGTTLAAAPTVQASGVFTSNVLQNSITLNWDPGDGAERIVLAKAGTTVADVPLDGTAYTANASFGLGSLIGSSHVVYRGAGNSVNVTDLSPATLYHFIIFEMNGTSGQSNYLTGIPGVPGSATTLALDGNQPTNLEFSAITTTSITLTWEAATAPGTTGYIVTRATSDVYSDPVNMTPYVVGNTIGGVSTVVHNSDDPDELSFNSSGLANGTEYFYRVYAKTAAATYVTTNPLTGSRFTLANEPASSPTALAFQSPTTSSLSGTFAEAAGSPPGYIVLEHEGSAVPPTDFPVDGTTYTAGSAINTSSVVYVGDYVSLPFTSTGLTSETSYHYAIFSFGGDGASINYRTSGPLTGNRSTLVEEPVDQPSGLVFSNLTTTSFDVSFADAPTLPQGYIVLRREGSAVGAPNIPADGIDYPVGAVIGGNTTVVHVGPGTSFSESGLAPGATYHYAAAAFNGSGETRNYLLTGAAAGVQATPATEPSAQPTGLVFGVRTQTSLAFSFNTATGSPAGYLVLRSSGGAPTGEPADGVAYTAGGLIGADVIVSFGTSQNIVDDNFTDGLVEGTQYYYSIFSFNGTTGTYNFLTTSPLQGNAFTIAGEPADHPINLAFANPTTTSVTVAFDEPAVVPAGYLVLRRQGSAPLGTPADGATYVAGNTIGSDLVVYVGASPFFTSTGMTASQIYHYAVFPFNGAASSSNFLTVAAASPVLTGSRTSLAVEPAAQPTALVYSNKSTSSVQVNFTASAAPRYLVLRRSGSSPTETPVDGVAYANNSTLGLSTVTYSASVADIPFIDGLTAGTAPMTAGTTYHYAIYAFAGFSGANNYLTSLAPLTGSVDLLALPPGGQPTLLTFSNVTGTSLTGSFTAATGSPDGYLAVRRSGSPPTGTPASGTAYNIGDPVGDGTVVHAGAATSFSDSGLSPEVTYYYNVFSFNGNGGSINYLTSAPLGGSRLMLATEPSPPTGINFSNITTNSVSMGFTQSDAQYYLILRKAGSAPTEVPLDGTGYVTGAVLGSSAIVLAGNIVSLPIAETGLSAGTVYHYAVYGYNGSGSSTYNYNTTSGLTGFTTTLVAEPSAQPGALTFSNIASASATVSYPAALGSPTGYLVILRPDVQPSSGPVDGTAYSTGSPLGGGVVVYVGPGITFNDIGLLPEKTYFYQVYAFNGSGSSINYLNADPTSGSFTTSANEPTAQPTSLSFGSITPTGFTVSFTPPAETVTGFIAIRKNGSAPTATPADRTAYIQGNTIGDGVVAFVGSASSFNESQTPAAWHYSVFSYNGSGGTINYKTTDALAGSVPEDTSPPNMTDNTPAMLLTGGALKVSFAISDPESGVASATLHYKPLNSATPVFSTKNLLLTSGSYEADLTTTEIGEQGLEYRVVAVNGRGVSGTGTTKRLRVSFPATATLPQIPAGTEEAHYRIISIPIALTNNSGDDVFAQLGDNQKGERWRMYYYDEGNVEITNLADFSVHPGEGYWLISRNSVTIAPGAGMAVDATEASPFVINLSPGWNLIGNPYLFNVLWADVNALNATELDLFVWNGDYDPGTILPRFSGGFVQAGGNLPLKIPTAKNPAASREGTVEPKRNAIDSRDWEVVVMLRNDDRKNSFGGVGMSDNASAGYDHLDNFTLPRLHNFLELNHEKKVYGMTYTKDIVPVAENYSWEFTVASSKAGATEMTWDNSYFGDNATNLVLWDDEEQLAIDMRAATSYSFGQQSERKFRILFGDDEYIRSETESDRVQIHSITPNPAISDVRVSFTLPGAARSHVNVHVVNGLGQQVASVFEGDLDSGYHELSWSGRDAMGLRPAQGVYLVEVITGKLRDSERLMIK
jgi:ELWxxDGT repeat protein